MVAKPTHSTTHLLMPYSGVWPKLTFSVLLCLGRLEENATQVATSSGRREINFSFSKSLISTDYGVKVRNL